MKNKQRTNNAPLTTIKKGYKNTEIGVIPEDWEVIKLKEISNLITKGTTPEKFAKKGVSYIKIESLLDDKINIDKCLFIDNKTHNNELKRSILNEGDLLFAIAGATIGKCTIVPKKIIPANTNQALAIIRLNENENENFIYVLLKSTIMQKYIIDNITVGAQPNLNLEQIGNFSFPLPPLPEQQAIATVLSDIDTLLSHLKTLIAKKKAIKQGAMQELLTAKKRLKDFSGDWEVKRLGEICIISKGQLITSSTKVDGKIPVIAGGKKPSYYHNEHNRTGKTITVSGSGANAGYISFHTYPIFASDCSTISESDNYSIEYIFYFLENLQNKIYKMQTGGAQPHIHPKDLNPITFPLPLKKEQQAIAQILTDMDTEIEALESQLQKTKNLKQGLMQELLTGKTRLVKPTLKHNQQKETIAIAAEPVAAYKTK